MLDCSLDMSSILNFLPLPLAGSSKFNSPSYYQNFKNPIERVRNDDHIIMHSVFAMI